MQLPRRCLSAREWSRIGQEGVKEDYQSLPGSPCPSLPRLEDLCPLIGQTSLAALSISLLSLVILPRHPNRLLSIKNAGGNFSSITRRGVLISTFLGLCLFGTLLLQLPWASTKGNIALVDAAFTSVSAVCVTGLTVLDTPHDFTLLGQWFILLLIQLGGLGIMTISTVALHAMGKRLSLRQERLLTTLTETSHSDLIGSLVMIVRFTLFTEFVGAGLLTGCFLSTGDSFHSPCGGDSSPRFQHFAMQDSPCRATIWFPTRISSHPPYYSGLDHPRWSCPGYPPDAPGLAKRTSHPVGSAYRHDDDSGASSCRNPELPCF